MYKKMFKSSSYLLIAQAVAKAVSFFYIVFLARILGVDNFGLYTAALAYFALVSSITDFGFNRYLIREGARDDSKLGLIVYNIILLRLGLTCIAFIVFALWLYLFDSDNLRSSLSIIAILAVIPQAVALTFDAALIAKQKIFNSALGIAVLSISTAFFGYLFIRIGYGTLGVVTAMIFGQIFYLIFLFITLQFNKFRFTSKITFTEIKKMIYGSFPYGVLGVLGLLYFRVDTLLLSYIKGSTETGLYGAAYKFLEAIVVVPSSFFAVLFPIIAKLHISDRYQIKKVYIQSIFIMGLLSIPTLLVYFFFLPIVIRIFLPQYEQSIEAIKILSFAIPFMFLQIPAISVLFSTDKYLKQIIVYSFFTLAFNVVLNLILIPDFGYIASSWITVVSEVLSFILFFFFIKRNILSRSYNS